MGRPRTALAAWIKENRARLGWKSEELAQRLDVSDSTVRGWESGRAVRYENLDAMERLFDREAPGHETSAPDVGTLVVAIEAQTAALNELAAALRDRDGLMSVLLHGLAEVQAQQSGQVHENSGRIDSLTVVLERLVELSGRASPAPTPRRETAE